MNSNKKTTEGIKAALIIEVIGKPPEHLTETLNDIITKISEEKGVKVTDKKINEPISMKDHKEFYTTFAEIEVEVENIMNLAVLIFKYMPANIEVISPEFIALTNSGWNEILNETVRRLHGYDEVARVLQVEKSILEKNLRSILENKKK